MPEPTDVDTLDTADLKTLVLALWARVAELDRTVSGRPDEITRLKSRPSMEPSGVEQGTQPKPDGKRTKQGVRGKMAPRVTPHNKELRVAVCGQGRGNLAPKLP